jgi:hypothetical protein
MSKKIFSLLLGMTLLLSAGLYAQSSEVRIP